MGQHTRTMIPIQVLAEIDSGKNPMQLTRERLERAATENQFMNGKIAAIQVLHWPCHHTGRNEHWKPFLLSSPIANFWTKPLLKIFPSWNRTSRAMFVKKNHLINPTTLLSHWIFLPNGCSCWLQRGCGLSWTLKIALNFSQLQHNQFATQQQAWIACKKRWPLLQSSLVFIDILWWLWTLSSSVCRGDTHRLGWPSCSPWLFVFRSVDQPNRTRYLHKYDRHGIIMFYSDLLPIRHTLNLYESSPLTNEMVSQFLLLELIECWKLESELNLEAKRFTHRGWRDINGCSMWISETIVYLKWTSKYKQVHYLKYCIW